jgi:hypothetical protein
LQLLSFMEFLGSTTGSLFGGILAGFALTGTWLVLRKKGVPGKGATVMIRWARGLGRTRVVNAPSARVQKGSFAIASPIMRESYVCPRVGERLGVQVPGQEAFRAEFLGVQGDAWILRKAS